MDKMLYVVWAVCVFKNDDRAFAATRAALKPHPSPSLQANTYPPMTGTSFPLCVAIKQMSRRRVSELPLSDAAME